MIANDLTTPILTFVRQNWIIRSLALVSLILLCGTGCSGINASHSVSPLDFFLPGLGGFVKTEPVPPSTVVSQTQVNSKNLNGSARELAKAN